MPHHDRGERTDLKGTGRTARPDRAALEAANLGTLHAFEAGHWPQIDAAAEVARLMLAAQA